MAASWTRRSLGLAVGVGCLLWTVTGSTWRDAAGELTAAACLPAAIAVAACAVALAMGTPWRRPAMWGSLALVGQAAALQLIDAGPRLHYQHYLPLGELWSRHSGAAAVLVAQTVLVAIGILRWRRTTERRLELPQRGRMIAAVALSALTAATVSPSPVRYVAELALAAYIQILAVATVVLAVVAVPDGVVSRVAGSVQRLFPTGETSERPPAPRDYFGVTAGGLAAVLAALLSVLSYDRHPHVPDEVVYLKHAEYLAAGMLTMPAPPVPAAFDLDLMSYETTQWFSPTPPGWPAMLAIGAALGVPWLVNPVLAGVCVVLTYLLLTAIYSRRVARCATVLLAVSPWFLFLAMSYMTQMLTLTCALTAALGVEYARRSGRAAWGVAAGCGVGVMSLIRPLDGVLVAGAIGLWAIGVGGRRLRVTALAGLVAGTAATGALVYPYNRALTGDGLTFPISVYANRLYGPNSNAYGFGKDRGLGWAFDPNPGHSPIDGVINLNLNAFGLNTDLFGWATGSLILIMWLMVAARLTRPDRTMLAGIAVFVIGYFFYYFSGGPDFGARYWFPAIVPLAALTARGLEHLDLAIGPRAWLAAGLLVAMSLVNYVPWRALDKYRDYRGMRAEVRDLAGAHGFASDLVLIRGTRFPDYASAAVLNPIDLKAPATIYAWDRNEAVRAEVLRAYPDRRVWIVEGPSASGAGYRVIEGPLTPEMALTSGGDQ